MPFLPPNQQRQSNEGKQFNSVHQYTLTAYTSNTIAAKDCKFLTGFHLEG